MKDKLLELVRDLGINVKNIPVLDQTGMAKKKNKGKNTVSFIGDEAMLFMHNYEKFMTVLFSNTNDEAMSETNTNKASQDNEHCLSDTSSDTSSVYAESVMSEEDEGNEESDEKTPMMVVTYSDNSSKTKASRDNWYV